MQNELLPLLQKYDVPVPRYTSYPTVPHWNPATFSLELWKKAVVDIYEAEGNEVCIYIHLPFCEELCTYCACNKRITKNHAVEEPYLETVLKEWQMYLGLFPSKPIIREIHLGGGTPTFFSPANLTKLIEGITEHASISPNHEFSVEVHPNFTTKEHLSALQLVGFNRISLGVQDFDPIVQFIINREQTFEQTKLVIDWARELGYGSVNIDLIYGLPKQTLESIMMTIDKVQQLKPDRIAFYSYAHVPWKSKGQRRYTDEDVPKAKEKLAMYQLGNELLAELGYVSIGMDHFALPEDGLMTAYAEGRLHRNFMGYTTTNHKLVTGLGASSISDTWNAFAQNEKTVETYQTMVNNGDFPIVGGHLLNEQDLTIRQHILNLMCKGETILPLDSFVDDFAEYILDKLKAFESDGLLALEGHRVSILPKGKLFIRNISSALDAYLFENQAEGNQFSKAI